MRAKPDRGVDERAARDVEREEQRRARRTGCPAYRNHGRKSSLRRRRQAPDDDERHEHDRADDDGEVARPPTTSPTSRLPTIAPGPWARNASNEVSAVMLFHWRYSVSHRADPIEAVGEIEPNTASWRSHHGADDEQVEAEAADGGTATESRGTPSLATRGRDR